ncbi:MAG: aldehyde ferredoxin oxidoreductase family protein [archaeon]|nr:aldehyde ferredoxin oxidoreductase family protein [archaeon]
MSQSRGYMGKILWVDLSLKEFKEEEPSEDIYRKFLGGYGLGIYYIYNRIKPGCDPLGPDNIIGFCPGLFTGTVAPFSGRYMVCGKSPLSGKGKRSNGGECNGGWADANSGGFFGPSIKRAGYDAIFFTGASDNPVYLLIDGDEKELKDASDLWGKDMIETEDILKERHKGGRIAGIGPAGENLSLISGIVNDKGRLAARGGLGAVMGSKKLKALCIKGNQKIVLADKDSTTELSKINRKRVTGAHAGKIGFRMGKMLPRFAPFMRKLKMGMSVGDADISKMTATMMHNYGTGVATALSSEVGDTPIKNYKGVGYIDFPQQKVRNLTSIAFEKYKIKNYACFSCPLGCGAILKVPELSLEETHRPEYETAAAFGGLIINSDAQVLLELNEYLNQTGMDTISAGGTVAFVLECVENGILSKEDFKGKEFPDGFLPEWDSSEYIMPLLRMMVKREGIGDILADGAYHAAQKIRKGSEQYALCFNGIEGGMHDLRYMKNLSITYLADPTPGRHTTGELTPNKHFCEPLNIASSKKGLEKISFETANFSKFYQCFSSLGLCLLSLQAVSEYPLLSLIKSISSWEITPEEYYKTGHRIQTLRQMFNAREGAIRHEVPDRAIGKPPHTKGPHKGVTVQVEELIKFYYKELGFAENGVPLKETLKNLDLGDCIEDLPQCTGNPKNN